MQKLSIGLAALLLACGVPVDAPPPHDGSPGDGGGALPEQLFAGISAHSERAAPIVGGTLLVTRDDTTVVAADPDRDRISFVNLHTLAVVSAELEPGAQPGRVTELAAGRIAAILNGAGSVAAFALDGSSVFRAPVCARPRGLAYLASQNAILVACSSGLLLKLDADSGLELSRQRFDDDLQDVLVRGDQLVLTRARSAELIFLDAAGKILRRGAPSPRASVAFRSVLLPNGEVLTTNNENLPESGNSYGSLAELPCGAKAVMSMLSITVPPPVVMVDPGGPAPGGDPRDFLAAPALSFESHPLPLLVGPIDVAISAAAEKVALLATGNGFGSDFGSGSLMVMGLEPGKSTLSQFARQTFDNCQSLRTERIAGQPVAVALDSRGRPYVQSREPAGLVLDNGVSVSLGRESRADTGLSLFYMNTGGQISCATCHPAGLEDGRTWFAVNSSSHELIPRRTQSLAGGIRARAPYHWAGELPTLSALVDEVMILRMQLQIAPTPAQVDSLDAWLEGIPAPAATDELDRAAVERGQALFFDPELACNTCHGGAQFTDDRSHDVGTGGVFYTPPLVAVGARAPYFHDGCAANLSGVVGACGGPTHDLPLDPAESADLVEFLRSL